MDPSSTDTLDRARAHIRTRLTQREAVLQRARDHTRGSTSMNAPLVPVTDDQVVSATAYVKKHCEDAPQQLAALGLDPVSVFQGG